MAMTCPLALQAAFAAAMLAASQRSGREVLLHCPGTAKTARLGGRVARYAASKRDTTTFRDLAAAMRVWAKGLLGLEAGASPQFLATARNIVMSLLRLAGCENVARGMEYLSRRLDQILALLGVLPEPFRIVGGSDGAGFPRNLGGGAGAGGHGQALLATGVLPVRRLRRDRFQGAR